LFHILLGFMVKDSKSLWECEIVYLAKAIGVKIQDFF